MLVRPTPIHQVELVQEEFGLQAPHKVPLVTEADIVLSLFNTVIIIAPAVVFLEGVCLIWDLLTFVDFCLIGLLSGLTLADDRHDSGCKLFSLLGSHELLLLDHEAVVLELGDLL